jgi:hypothetical protein
MDPTLLSSLTPFGAAGLIAFLWLTERKSSGERERQLSEAHDRLVRHRSELSLLVNVVRENTRALTALEASLRSGRGTGADSPGVQERATDRSSPPAGRAA